MAHGEKQASAIALRGVSRPLDLKRNRQSPGLSALQPGATLMTERAVHLPPRPEGNPRATTVVQRP